MYWYEHNNSEVCNAVVDLVQKLQQDHSERIQSNLEFMRMYGQKNYTQLGTSGALFKGQQAGMRFNPNVMRLNVAQSQVDTITSKIGRNKPRPLYLTRQGDYMLRRKAKRLGDSMEGLFMEQNLYNLMPRIFTDACVQDLGVLKIFREGDKIKSERVFSNHIFWDFDEALYAAPRSMFQRMEMHKSSLIHMFPEKSQQIEASGIADSYSQETDHEQELTDCYEGWHLPTSEDSDDGRHVICLDGVTLLDEHWNYDKFPFVFLRWSDAPLGFSGTSLVEQLDPVQREINSLLIRIQQSMALMSSPYFFVPIGSKVSPNHLRNAPGTILMYAGQQPPVAYVPQAMSGEVYNHLDRLLQRAYEISGISELSATGRKPSGLDSGVALRIYTDIETERHMLTAQQYEQAFMDAASWYMDFAEEIVEDSGSYTVRSMRKKGFDVSDFKDVRMAQEDYQLQAFPISLLPSTPAGRIQTVQELINMGVIDSKEQITKLLDYPDLGSVTHWMETAENDVEWRISKILDESEYIAPDPLMNLELAKSRMQLAYLEARQQGVEQEKLDMMLTFVTQAQGMLNQAQMPSPMIEGPEGPAQTMAPTGETGTPETENMTEMGTESPMELSPEMDTEPPPETLPS